MIRYSIERLYHFNCDECGAWFSIGDWNKQRERSDQLTCPNCGELQNVEMIKVDADRTATANAKITGG